MQVIFCFFLCSFCNPGSGGEWQLIFDEPYLLPLLFNRTIHTDECCSLVTLYELLSSRNRRWIVGVYSPWLKGLFCHGRAGRLICDFHRLGYSGYFLNQTNELYLTPLDRWMIKVLTFAATSCCPSKSLLVKRHVVSQNAALDLGILIKGG